MVRASESVEISGTSSDGLFPSGLFARVGPVATETGANLTIRTGQLLVQDGAEVSTSTFGSGKAGNLSVEATQLVRVSGTDDSLFGSNLGAIVQPRATGDGGNLTIDTGRLIVRDGGQVLTSTFGAGNAGNLTVQSAMEVELVGGVVADAVITGQGSHGA